MVVTRCFWKKPRGANSPIRLILPFPKKRFEEDFSPGRLAARPKPLIESALFVEEITGPESNDEAYLETGILTVEHAEVMVFLSGTAKSRWRDGRHGRHSGIRPRSSKKPLLIIDPATGDITEEGFNLDAAKKRKSRV